MALDPIEIARLNALGDRLRRIQVEFSTTRESTPVNLATERERVTEAIARGQILVSEFRYRAADNSSIALVSEASDLLRSSAASATDWDALVHEEVRMHLRTLEALRSHDADVITSLTLSRVRSANACVDQSRRSYHCYPRSRSRRGGRTYSL